MQECIGRGGDLGVAIKRICTLADDMNWLKEMGSDRRALKAEFEQAFNRIEDAIANYEKGMQRSETKLATINVWKEAVELSLKTHCTRLVGTYRGDCTMDEAPLSAVFIFTGQSSGNAGTCHYAADNRSRISSREQRRGSEGAGAFLENQSHGDSTTRSTTLPRV